MKTCFFTLAVFALLGLSFTGSKHISRYESFDKTLVIHLYHGGGMAYESNNIYIRYDSCIYIQMHHGHDHVKRAAMDDKSRQQVLSLLKDNRFYDLKQDMPRGFAHDKATTSICAKQEGKDNFCIETGASKEVAEKDRAAFGEVYDKLFAFAQTLSK